MTTTTLSSKGQLVVPLELRQQLGLTPGDQLVCEIEQNRLVLFSTKKRKAQTRNGEDGLPILSAPEGAPQMTPELVKTILSE